MRSTQRRLGQAVFSGWFTSTSGFVNFFAQPIMGRLSDTIGRRKVWMTGEGSCCYLSVLPIHTHAHKLRLRSERCPSGRKWSQGVGCSTDSTDSRPVGAATTVHAVQRRWWVRCSPSCCSSRRRCSSTRRTCGSTLGSSLSLALREASATRTLRTSCRPSGVESPFRASWRCPHRHR
jgi:hypothetical protein